MRFTCESPGQVTFPNSSHLMQKQPPSPSPLSIYKFNPINRYARQSNKSSLSFGALDFRHSTCLLSLFSKYSSTIINSQLTKPSTLSHNKGDQWSRRRNIACHYDAISRATTTQYRMPLRRTTRAVQALNACFHSFHVTFSSITRGNLLIVSKCSET